MISGKAHLFGLAALSVRKWLANEISESVGFQSSIQSELSSSESSKLSLLFAMNSLIKMLSKVGKLGTLSAFLGLDPELISVLSLKPSSSVSALVGSVLNVSSSSRSVRPSPSVSANFGSVGGIRLTSSPSIKPSSSVSSSFG